MMGNLAGADGAFNHAGFARNAFGGRNAWNRGWNYGGYGWNGWGYSWGGWYGPVFWPYFYGDLLSFALWPGDFYDPFFGYGPDFLFSSIFWPAYGPDVYGWEENPYDVYSSAGGATTRQAPSQGAEFLAEAGSACAALAPGITDLPIDRIQKAIDPNDTQKAILADLQAASDKANDVLRGSCPGDTPLTPVSRLDTVGKRIDAMLQAVQITRAPLTTLDNSLDDAQRQRFNTIVLGERSRRKPQANANTLADLCSGQAKNFTNLPTAQIEQTLKPSGQQQTAALNALKDASAKAASSIESSCPSTMPQSFTDRFNAIVKRLDAMAGAVKTVEPALKELYSSLDDDQKARFNVMQPPSDVQTPPS
jgi:LTXXQ motif family protein